MQCFHTSVCVGVFILVQESAVEKVGQWVSDPICNTNPHVILVAGLIYAQAGNYVEALKACHTGQTLEM